MATTTDPIIQIPDIKLTKCEPDRVRKMLKGLGLDTAGTTKAIVTRLAEYYAAHEQRLAIADCTTCGADSDADLDACPFCGEAEFEPTDGDGDKPTESKSASSNGKSTDCIACGGSGKSSKNKPCGPCKGTGKKGGTAPAKKVAAKKAPAKKAPAKKAPAKKVAAKKAPAKASTAKKTLARKSVKGTKVAAPTPAKATALAHVTVVHLEKQIKAVTDNIAAGGVALHRMGVALQAIDDAKLWKTRMDKSDKVAKYRSFKQFVHEDIGLSPSHAFRAMAVAREFKESEVAGFSGREVRVMMAPEKKPLPAAASGGKGKNAKSAAANALTGKGNKNTKPPKPKNAVEVSMAMGASKVTLYKRPTKGDAKVADPDTSTPAKSLSERPWFVLQLENEVRMIVRLDTNSKGELIGVVEFRKGETIL